MTVARVITRSVADVVEQLELDGDTVVTINRLAGVMRQLGLSGDPRRLAYELQRDGWLGNLRTRHAWEFLPGARGGRYGSGDRFIEFRAQQAVNATWPGVLAMESAASVLGLAQRVPEQEVVALAEGEPFPKALTGRWRYVRIHISEEGIASINGLRTWDREGLIVGVAVRPSSYKDVAGLGQWMSASVYEADIEKIIRLLQPMTAAARQRAAYLLWASENLGGAERIVAAYPPTATAWLGPRQPGGRYEPLTKVSDTLVHNYLSVGNGS
ncbi:MAG: type IV toxin-antitoxin system AbiEi family antitoxin [Candidatus Nanopelagicales bacterium]|nr:type IV toxin-antitoxin system AbiEi family antitoxin [Candidatus Nanopelagicales bacterium]MDZ4250743.1 type IV toxin-antitoxin system AbiEi family antitoxin [Candidatus Nanopelagicales bacterium]